MVSHRKTTDPRMGGSSDTWAFARRAVAAPIVVQKRTAAPVKPAGPRDPGRRRPDPLQVCRARNKARAQ